MLPVGQKSQNEDVESDDSESKPAVKRNGRRKIKIEYIEDKNRRHITFSKRKAGIMKKAYELSTLTGTQVLLLVVSETGLVYTFTTTKLQPIVTKPEGKNLIQACLNTPDPSLPDVNAAETKLEDGGGGHMSHPSTDTGSISNASPVPIVNRIPEDTSQSQLSPQTASSQSPMIQPASNVIRQQQQTMVVPPITAANANLNPVNNTQQQQQQNALPVNYSQSNNRQQPPSHPQLGGMPPYTQQRYPPHQGFHGNLPQPNHPFPPSQHSQAQQPHYGGHQQPYYQQSPHQPPQQQQHHAPPTTGPPPLGYWSFHDQHQGNTGNAGPPASSFSSSQQQQQARQNIKSERP